MLAFRNGTTEDEIVNLVTCEARHLSDGATHDLRSQIIGPHFAHRSAARFPKGTARARYDHGFGHCQAPLKTAARFS